MLNITVMIMDKKEIAMDHGFGGEKAGYEAGEIGNPILDDITAGARYGSQVGANSDACPEKRLMLAILSDAIDCLRRGLRSSESAEALDWILDQDSDRLCSFGSVCDTLGLEPSSVRSKVLESVAWSSSVAIPVLARTRKQRISIRVAA